MSEPARLRERVSDGLHAAAPAAQPMDHAKATPHRTDTAREINAGSIALHVAVSLSVGAFSAALIALAVPYAVTVALASFFAAVLVGLLFYALFGKTSLSPANCKPIIRMCGCGKCKTGR